MKQIYILSGIIFCTISAFIFDYLNITQNIGFKLENTVISFALIPELITIPLIYQLLAPINKIVALIASLTMPAVLIGEILFLRI